MALTEAEELELLELEESEKAKTPNSPAFVNKITGDAIRERLLGPASNLPLSSIASLMQSPEARNAAVNNLPTAGAIVGGLLPGPIGASPLIGTAIRSTSAGLGAAGGEALRQLIERARGNEYLGSGEASARIGKQAALAGATEAVTPSIVKLAGKVAKPLVRTGAKIGAAFSGTRPQNLVRAYGRGLKETFLPKGQEFLTRASSGDKQTVIEKSLYKKFFSPEERAALKLKDSSQAQKFIEDALIQKEIVSDIGEAGGSFLTPKQALGTVQAIDTKYPTPLSKAQEMSAEYAKLRGDARAVIAEKFPEYSKALKTTEKAITRSQLLKPFKVNRSNPDQYSGFTGAISPIAGGALASAGQSVLPLIAGIMGSSPLAFGLAAGTAGSLANAASSKLGSRVIAQGAGNPLLEALFKKLKKKEDSGR